MLSKTTKSDSLLNKKRSRANDDESVQSPNSPKKAKLDKSSEVSPSEKLAKVSSFIQLMDGQPSGVKIVLQQHVMELINTIQYYCSQASLTSSTIDDIVRTFKYITRGFSVFSDNDIADFVNLIADYAITDTATPNSYFVANSDNILYTEAIIKIIESCNLTSTGNKWSAEYMSGIAECNSKVAYATLFDRNAVQVLRIARATSDLNKITTMYKSGLSFEELDSFENHAGFDGVMLGRKDWPYHLEFTICRNTELAEVEKEVIHPENGLVFYYKNEATWQNTCEKMIKAGFKIVAAVNPYWDSCGKTFVDIDGHKVILTKTDWSI